ncbi:MAG: hypothetical protein DI586_02525 [Micavibrio aeruginosavorus]|uniref:Uncharacterized protein n=1 Tax=Micavibrio aeruginosavorus TaxID=349221 RepID=A0A2W5FQV9_9BACT|nr:MAG: hypothetical protein DI586_02525 [Micavibrio aeruginosavorus]
MNENIFWWLSAIEIPVLSGLFWMIWKVKSELSDYKIEVANFYARSSDVMQVETRLTSHLLRIEAKLDVTALKTESLKAKQ